MRKEGRRRKKKRRKKRRKKKKKKKRKEKKEKRNMKMKLYLQDKAFGHEAIVLCNNLKFLKYEYF